MAQATSFFTPCLPRSRIAWGAGLTSELPSLWPYTLTSQGSARLKKPTRPTKSLATSRIALREELYACLVQKVTARGTVFNEFLVKRGRLFGSQAQQSRLVDLASLRDMKTALSRNLTSLLVVPCHAVKKHPLAHGAATQWSDRSGPVGCGMACPPASTIRLEEFFVVTLSRSPDERLMESARPWSKPNTEERNSRARNQAHRGR